MKNLVQYVFEKKGVELPYNNIELDEVVATFKWSKRGYFPEDDKDDIIKYFEKYKPVDVVSPWKITVKNPKRMEHANMDYRYNYFRDYGGEIKVRWDDEFEGFYLAKEKRSQEYKLYAIANDNYEQRMKKENAIKDFLELVKSSKTVKVKYNEDPVYRIDYTLIDTIDKKDLNEKSVAALRRKYLITSVLPAPYTGESRGYNLEYNSDKYFAKEIMETVKYMDEHYGDDFLGVKIILHFEGDKHSALIWNIVGKTAKNMGEYGKRIDDHISSYYDGNHYNGD